MHNYTDYYTLDISINDVMVFRESVVKMQHFQTVSMVMNFILLDQWTPVEVEQMDTSLCPMAEHRTDFTLPCQWNDTYKLGMGRHSPLVNKV